MKFIGIFLRGVMMGAADIVPGVSGGTIAFITGIYDTLLASIRAFDLTFLSLLFRGDIRGAWTHVNGSFLSALLLGIGTSIVSLARLISWILENHPVPLWAFFFGLIFASAVVLLRQVEGWTLGRAVCLLAGVLTAGLIAFSPVANMDIGLAGVFLAGFLAICAMILPGISGSFILVLLGMYGTVLAAVKSLDLLFLLVFILGCGAGLLCFSRLLYWLLHRFHQATMALLTGFLFGSLAIVWPWKHVLDWVQGSHGQLKPAQQVPVSPAEFLALTGQEPAVGLCLTLMALGFALVWLIDYSWGGTHADNRPGSIGPALRFEMEVFIRLLSILLVLTLAGCGSSGRAPVEDRRGNSAVKVYQVQRGDTLYSIAFRYGLDYRKVAEVNSIPEPYIIYPGQHLYLWQLASSPLIVSGPPQTPAPVVSDNPGLPAAYTPSPVIVTAVPGIAAPPVSQVAMPPSPVYQGGNPGARSDAASGAPSSPSAPVTGGTVAGVNSVAAPATATSAPPVVATAPVAAPGPTAAPRPSRAPTPGARVTSWRWPSSGSVTRRYSSSVHKGIDIGGNRGDPVYAVADGTVVYAGTGIVGFGELIILKHNDIYISAYGHNSRLLVREGDVVGVGQIIAEKGSTGTDTVKLHFEIRKEGKPIDPLKLLPRR